MTVGAPTCTYCHRAPHGDECHDTCGAVLVSGFICGHARTVRATTIQGVRVWERERCAMQWAHKGGRVV